MQLPIVKTKIQIRYADLDPLDHVSNTVYGQYFELGRMAWYDAILKEQADTVIPTTVVANMTIDYIIELKLDDDVYVETACVKKGNKSFHLSQNIYANGRLATRSTVVMVGFDKETRTTCVPLAGWQPSESN
ncbi:acyl-CoA thioesterase [Thalassotalea piscium]